MDHSDVGPLGITLYKRRWFMLFIFSWFSLTNSLNWITFAPIAPTVIDQYEVSPLAVNMLSMIYMVIFIPGVIPASYIVDTYGLRVAFNVGAFLNVLGALIRILPYPLYSISEVSPYSFIPVFIGQSICAAAQTFIIAMPPYLAQNWFGESERVTATAIGALANQLGIAVGFFLCPFAVPEGSDDSRITFLLILLSAFCISSLLLIVFFFRSTPPSSPSVSAQGKERSDETSPSIIQSLLYLLKDRNYMNLCVCFGLIIGCFYAVSTLLGQMLVGLFYSDSAVILVGTLMVVVGIVGAFLFGVVGDKLKNYKVLLVVCILGNLLSVVFWCFVFREDRLILVSVGSSLLGFFMTALLPICMDVAVEITYPLPEAIVSNVLLASAQIFGILLIAICTPLLERVSALAVNTTLLLTSSVAMICILFLTISEKRTTLEQVTQSKDTQAM